MQKSQDEIISWVRFPNKEAKLCIMSHPDRGPGLLLLHENSERGQVVAERARAAGFSLARMRSGGMAAVIARGKTGYPFGLKQLARMLGGEIVDVPKSVILSEAYPRPAASNAPAPTQETPVPQTPETYVADASVGEEIATFLSDIDLRPDIPVAEKTKASEAPEFA